MPIVFTLLLLLVPHYPDRVCVGSSKEDPKAFPVPVVRTLPRVGISGELRVAPEDGFLTLYVHVDGKWREVSNIVIWRYQYPCSCKQ